MIDYADLARRLKGRSLGASMSQEEADDLMPLSYRFSNPNGRPYHDDWTAPWLPRWAQPWGKIRRMDTTFMLPLPLKIISGNMKPRWIPLQEGYVGGLSPEAQVRDSPYPKEAALLGYSREVLACDPVGVPGEWGTFAVWLDLEWRECYTTVTKIVGGRRFHTNRILKPDMTHGDFMLNFPDASATWTTVR